MKKRYVLIVFLCMAAVSVGAEEAAKKSWYSGEWYGSWGYNTALYQRSSIHFKQAALGNDFTLHRVSAHHAPGFDLVDFNIKHLTVPQFSMRLGHFFNQEKGLAWEINFDHYKYVVDHNQEVRISGKVGNTAVDGPIQLTPGVLRYRLNNGANLLLFNLVKRLPLFRQPNEKNSVAILVKAGLGIMIPHVQNTVFGVGDDYEFQFGGFGGGLESALRYTPFKHVYFEVSHKYFIADYRGIQVNEGTADQTIVGQSTSLSIGTYFNL